MLAERGQIGAALPVQHASPQGDGAGADPPAFGSQCVTLSSAFLARGRSDAVPLSDFIDCVTSAQKALRFPSWNQNACKVKNLHSGVPLLAVTSLHFRLAHRSACAGQPPRAST